MKTRLALWLLLPLCLAAALPLPAQTPAPGGGAPPSPEPLSFPGVVAIAGAVVLLARVIVLLTPTPRDDNWYRALIEALKKVGLHLPALALALPLLTGCAHFSTTQKDVRNEDGTTTIVTRASATTLFSARSELARFKASQTEKSQGAEVGALNQQGGTNTVAVLEALAKIVGALPK